MNKPNAAPFLPDPQGRSDVEILQDEVRELKETVAALAARLEKLERWREHEREQQAGEDW